MLLNHHLKDFFTSFILSLTLCCLSPIPNVKKYFSLLYSRNNQKSINFKATKTIFNSTIDSIRELKDFYYFILLIIFLILDNIYDSVFLDPSISFIMCVCIHIWIFIIEHYAIDLSTHIHMLSNSMWNHSKWIYWII